MMNVAGAVLELTTSKGLIAYGTLEHFEAIEEGHMVRIQHCLG
jgi:hypothetical protein